MQKGLIGSQPNTDPEKNNLNLAELFERTENLSYGSKINLNNKDTLKYSQVLLT